MIQLKILNDNAFSIYFKNHLFFSHSKENPIVTIGISEGSYQSKHGNYKIKEKKKKIIPFTKYKVNTYEKEKIHISFIEGMDILFREIDNKLILSFIKNENSNIDNNINRLTLTMSSNKNEKIYGCGEQYSELNLKGKKVPLWCEEQGVGRGKDLLTFLAEVTHGAGGHWYSTYYPQQSFVSSDNYFVYVKDTNYAIFDFRKQTQTRLYIWGIPSEIIIDKQETAPEIINSITNYLGKQPPLPSWVYDGVWLGIQGGVDIVENKIKKAKEKNMEISAIWCQDWEGKRITSFGKQLMWNWKYDSELYPDLPNYIKKLNKEGIKFLGYINPFLAIEKDLYKEASEKGFVVKNKNNEDYLIYVTTFPAALVDLSNPEAFKWIKEVIKKYMIGIGLSGWMADFGEYLPNDCVLYSKENPESFHNKYPVLWAKANIEAINEAGKSDEIVFFTRAGYSETSKYSPIIWAGDQNVDWSINDGLASVIPAGISLGFSGIGVHHSDIGGYTTVAWLKRSKELFMRWAEHSAFTMIMRTHEGNRPDKNWQFDSDDETLIHFAYMSRIHKKLKPYLKKVSEEYKLLGLSAMRHPYIHYERDKILHKFKYQYLLGRDMLVAPIYKQGKKKQNLYLPPDKWIHLWTGQIYDASENGRYIEIDAPIGKPPVFYRAESEDKELFESLSKIHK